MNSETEDKSHSSLYRQLAGSKLSSNKPKYNSKSKDFGRFNKELHDFEDNLFDLEGSTGPSEEQE